MGSPAVFFTYALMFRVFGHSMAAVPITDVLVSLLTTYLVFLLARSVWDKRVGYVSALLFAFFSNGVRLGLHAGGEIAFGTFWYIAQRETFILPLIAGSLYLILRAEKKNSSSWRWIFSGFLAGLAFVYKFPSLIVFVCLLFYVNSRVLLSKEKKDVKSLLSKDVFWILGFVVALVPFVVYFAARGALHEMLDVNFRYVFSVYGHSGPDYLGMIKMGLVHTLFIAKENFILWIFSLTSTLYILIIDRTKEHLMLVLWALGSVLFILSHREFFGYHYLIILPPFSILSGYGLVRGLGPRFNLRQLFTTEFSKTFILFALLGNLAFFVTLNYMHYTKFFYYATGKITQEQYYDFFSAFPKHEYSFPADLKVARYIKKHTDDEDMIFTLGGTESVVHFLSKRKSPSRFIFSWFLFSPTHGQVEQSEAYRRELLLDLQRKSPRYIMSVGSLETFKQFSPIHKFIQKNYILEKMFPDDRFLYAFRGDGN
jgi:hypothetical protein